jgi:hypothetical protein
MSTRRAKQLIYGALYVIVLLMLFAVIYLLFIRPFMAPSAVVCTSSTCAPADTAPITGELSATFMTSPGHYTFLAQAANGSANYGIQVLNYEIDLYNASDTVIQSIPGQSFIYPMQNKYLVIPNVFVGLPFDHARMNITSVAWLASSTLGANPGIASGQFGIQNIQAIIASTTVSVGGQLVNMGVASYEKVIVIVIFHDTNGSPLGASQTEIDNLKAGETTTFSVMYPAASNVNPALNQIIVYAIR